MPKGESTISITIPGREKPVTGTLSWNISDKHEAGFAGQLRKGTIKLEVPTPTDINWSKETNVAIFSTAVQEAFSMSAKAALTNSFQTTKIFTQDGKKQEYAFSSASIFCPTVSGSAKSRYSKMTIDAEAAIVYKAVEPAKSKDKPKGA